MYSASDIKNLHIEFSSLCNARCPLCPRNLCGVPYNGGYCETNLSLDTVKLLPISFIQNLKQIVVNGNFGDFILNPESLEILAYMKSLNPLCSIEVSTNGSARNEDFWIGLANIGIKISFCIDGLADTHNLYRQDTVWEKIKTNAKVFIDNGGMADWKMIKFAHNVHQFDECKRLSKELGFTTFTMIDHGRNSGPVYDRHENMTHVIGDYVGNGDLEFRKTQNKFKFPDIPEQVNCSAKKGSGVYISAEGKVYPCCYLGFSPETYTLGWTGWANKNFKHLVKNNDLRYNTLEECIEWFSAVPAAWTSPDYNSGRIIHCDQACGRKVKNDVTFG